MRIRTILTILITGYSATAFAEDVTADYMAKCTATQQTPSACQCALNAFSQRLRDNRKRELPSLMMGQKAETTQMLSDPALSQSRIDAVCDLDDQIADYSLKASVANRDGDMLTYRGLSGKASKLDVQKEDLSVSYNAMPQNIGGLAGGNFCKNRRKMREIQQDQAGDGNGLYPELRRYLEIGMPSYAPIFGEGYDVNCLAVKKTAPPPQNLERNKTRGRTRGTRN